MRRNTWLLYVIAFPATIAIWGGWVSLGKLCGFGPVSLLPGIADVVIDTSIALPIGMEAYSAYALYVWLSSQGLGTGTRRYAKWSALGALVLGSLGQVAYHVLTVSGYGGTGTAPVPIVVFVSVLPVLVLGTATGLAHAVHRDTHAVPAVQESDSEPRIHVGVTRVPESDSEGSPAVSALPVREIEPVAAERPAVPETYPVPEPAVPVPSPAVPETYREPEPVPGTRGTGKDWSTHPRWDEAVRLYEDSGRTLTGTQLAEKLGMKNKSLALAVKRSA